MRVTAVSAALLSALVLAAGADARTRPACQTEHGKSLLRTRALLVYSRVNRGDSYRTLTVYACVRRSGRTRKIGKKWELGTSNASTTIESHAGVHLVVDTSSGDQYASTERITWWNIASGRKRTLYALDAPMSGPTYKTGVPLDRALLTSDGCTLLAHSTDSTANTATVLTRPFSGSVTELDRGTSDAIPAASLALSGRTASWTNAGVQRTSELPPANC
jgi:hypothetical protein